MEDVKREYREKVRICLDQIEAQQSYLAEILDKMEKGKAPIKEMDYALAGETVGAQLKEYAQALQTISRQYQDYLKAEARKDAKEGEIRQTLNELQTQEDIKAQD